MPTKIVNGTTHFNIYQLKAQVYKESCYVNSTTIFFTHLQGSRSISTSTTIYQVSLSSRNRFTVAQETFVWKDSIAHP